MTRYWKEPELTEGVLKDGWLRTGDWGRLDEDMAITVVDRKKDMIITGGENVYPKEVEDALRLIDGVSDVAVVGLPDPVWGQIVCACIVAAPNSNLTSKSVVEASRKSLAGYKKPKKVVFLKELPLNSLGKVVKFELV